MAGEIEALYEVISSRARGPGSRTKRSLAVLRNRITRRLRNDAETEGRKVDGRYRAKQGDGEGLTPFE